MMEEVEKKKETPLCPKCKNSAMARVPREGLLENRVYAKAGLFPWECPLCRNRALVKNRGQRIRRKRKEGEPAENHLPRTDSRRSQQG